MKKFCSVALAVALVMGCMPFTTFAADISVTAKGAAVEFTDAKPYINSDSRTLVPLRAIAEALDLYVTWDDGTKSATFADKEGRKKIIFVIGEDKYTVVDGDISKEVKMDTEAVVTDDRTYAPARYLAEAFGYNVSWDDINSVVSITESNLDNESKMYDERKDISSFIPEGWEISKAYGDELAIAEGDLNNDGIMDKAFVIEEKDVSESVAQRNLIIVFGNTDNSYSLAITAKNAILRADEGGTFGDPFESIDIDNGSVLLNFMGGSIRWHRCFRFRYQDNNWYLIGFTEKSYELIGDSMECLQEDYNLITGDYIGDMLEYGKIKTVQKNIGKKQLLNLNDFVANEYNIQP